MCEDQRYRIKSFADGLCDYYNEVQADSDKEARAEIRRLFRKDQVRFSGKDRIYVTSKRGEKLFLFYEEIK